MSSIHRALQRAALSSLMAAALVTGSGLHAASIDDTWLTSPCELLSADDVASLLPASAASVTRKPRQGKYDSECVVSDMSDQTSLRLVLHPARDVTRIARQLERLAASDPSARRIAIEGHHGILLADGRQLSVGVEHWMVSLFASAPMSEDVAIAVATDLVARIGTSGGRP